jgi:hypothetical protein
MRFVVAKRNGQRGAGLGNEILPWAKGWIASQVLDARLVGPSWGINPRRYFRNFQTSRLDFLLEDALRRLPHHSFTKQDFSASGEADFGTALKKWAAAKGLTNSGSYIVTVGGMWGGYASIQSARQFLFAKLLNSKDALANLHQLTSSLDPGKLTVAVHMRTAGDGFQQPSPSESVRGKFNILVPGDWYLWICEQLQRTFRNRIQFHFFTDRPGPWFQEAVRRFNPGQITQTGLTECSDLLFMSQADLRVCSVSSYSLAANYLSEGPFVWYEPQLTLEDGDYSLWGKEEGLASASPLETDFQRCLFNTDFGGSRECVPPSTFLGTPMNIGDSLPDSLAGLLDQKLTCRNPQTNLLGFGSLPQAAMQQKGCSKTPIVDLLFREIEWLK